MSSISLDLTNKILCQAYKMIIYSIPMAIPNFPAGSNSRRFNFPPINFPTKWIPAIYISANPDFWQAHSKLCTAHSDWIEHEVKILWYFDKPSYRGAPVTKKAIKRPKTYGKTKGWSAPLVEYRLSKISNHLSNRKQQFSGIIILEGIWIGGNLKLRENGWWDFAWSEFSWEEIEMVGICLVGF